MPSTTFLEIPPAEQVQMRAILRRARYGYLLAFHILLLCAAGRNPTEIATFLLCSRSSVYRIVRAYRAGSLGIRIDPDGQLSIAVQSTILMPWLTRSLGALLKKGFCRKVRFLGKTQKLGVRNSMAYRPPNSRKSNFATEPLNFHVARQWSVEIVFMQRYSGIVTL
jgi:hypothetical protein